jgi:hypothetical protein
VEGGRSYRSMIRAVQPVILKKFPGSTFAIVALITIAPDIRMNKKVCFGVRR